jgi:tetratricopeptide (TPR) repeat protein
VGRNLGHVRLQGIAECNLGLAEVERGHAREALAHFESALRSMRVLGDRRSEGQFLGYLGRARARLNEFGAARDCFSAGEALLCELSDTLSLGVLLCDRAECEWQAGNATAAHQAFEQARAMADEARAGSQSELGLALAHVQGLLIRT